MQDQLKKKEEARAEMRKIKVRKDVTKQQGIKSPEARSLAASGEIHNGQSAKARNALRIALSD